MKRDLIKRVALLTAIWTAGNAAGITDYNRFLPVMPAARLVYAASMSEEERALQRAEQELIEAQHKVIEAQRALLEKQRRQLENRREESDAASERPRRETAKVKQHKESYETQRSESPAVQYKEPPVANRNEWPAEFPVQNQQETQVAEPDVQWLPETEIRKPVAPDMSGAPKSPAAPKRTVVPQVQTVPEPPVAPQVQTAPKTPTAPQVQTIPKSPAGSSTPSAVDGHKTNINQGALNDDTFTNAVWTENNGGVVANAPVKEETKENTKVASLLSGWTAEDIDTLRKQNNGVLATEEKMIYTTDPSIMFTFTGMGRKRSVDSVLNALKQVNGRGTFFVTERELKRNPDVIRGIVDHGQELGICIYPKPEESFGDICADILRVKQILKKQYGKDSNLVKQFSGAVSDVTKEAVSALGCRLIGANMNAVQSRHKEYQTAEQILPEIVGKAVFSLGRGWIVNVRMDFYKKPDLAAELLLYLKRKKIDNIAYNAFDDVAGINPENDSAYQLKSIGEVLAEKGKLWTCPVPEKDYVKGIERYPLLPHDATHEQLVEELGKRYFGEGTVNAHDRSLGFTEEDFAKFDMTGTVKTDDNVIFLTFDDWGHDSAINPLLYVLRKHGVPATFFIITHNVMNSPNLLRAIAEEGHDIASHTNSHKAMVVEDEHGKSRSTMGYEEYYNDMNTSYNRLASIVGDLQWPDGRPVLTKFMRPPTLAISAMGTRAILENGFEYIINGSTSTADYGAPTLESEIKVIRDGLYYRDKLRKGAIFVMHMTSAAKFTATALDVILTANEKKADGDPTKFKVGLLSDYLNYGYSQGKTKKQLNQEKRRIKWW